MDKWKYGVLAAIVLCLTATDISTMANTKRDVPETRNISQRIQPSRIYPVYWQYKGKPVLLLGGSDGDALLNWPDVMMANMQTLERIGGNYVRCNLSSRNEGSVAVP